MTMTQTAEHNTVRVSRVVEASIERVWAAWTDPQQKQRWWGRAEGMECHLCEMDVRVGGQYRYGTRPLGSRDTHADVDGEYLVVEPPHKLVYTWSWTKEEPQVRDTLVTLEFEDLGGGRTRVHVTHSQQPSVDVAAIHDAGWHAKLADLAADFSEYT
ncbi:MAG: SRPBCC domain-containing protein [Pseudomonadota bacterium]